jgi:tetratricopeptide (TPR) repeat protein
MRRIVTALIAAAAGTAAALSAGQAAAQTYTPTEYQEYVVNAKKLHGKRVQMHAVFNSDEPVYSDGTFGEEYFKNNGIKAKNHYRFSVVFRNQSKEWLYPVMEKKGKSHAIWKQILQRKKGEKITLFGRLKLMGDTGGKAFVPGRTGVGGGYAEVPSVLKVERVMLGWVKTREEYIQDLGGDAEQVAETIVMLTREGPGVLPLLVKVSQSSGFSDTVRANAARAVGAFKSANQLGKLELTIKKAGDSEKIKNAALRAMATIKPAAALAHLGELAGRTERDEWVPYGAAELLAGGFAETDALAKAVGDGWKTLAPEVADALLETAEDRFDAKKWEEAERYAGRAIAVDAKSGPAFHLRGKARLAQAAKKPEAKRLAGEDFTQALKLGEESPDLWLHRGRQLLAAGDKQQAAEMAELVLEEEPKNVAALKLRAEAEGKSAEMIDCPPPGRTSTTSSASRSTPCSTWRGAPSRRRRCRSRR